MDSKTQPLQMNLQQKLEEALRNERYEEAAELRDRIAAGEVDSGKSEYMTQWEKSPYGFACPVRNFMDQLNETPHEFYVRKSKEERALRQAQAIEAYQRACQEHHDEVAKAKRHRIMVVMSESEPAIHELLLKRLQKGRKKLSSESVAKGIVRVRDHRDHTDSYVWRGKEVLKVKYTTSGFEVQQ